MSAALNHASLVSIKRNVVSGLMSGAMCKASDDTPSCRENKRLRTSTKQGMRATSPLSVDIHAHDELWTLDEQQDHKHSPQVAIGSRKDTPSSNAASETDSFASPADAFLRDHSTPACDTAPIHRLARPVVLPQKRPTSQSRGFFIRAYAPCLEPSGISQDMFLDFLEAFDASAQPSTWLNVVNLAGWGSTSVPDLPIAVQLSMMAAKDAQSRTRVNSFLDRANAQVFMPRGLYCVVVTYRPVESTSQDSTAYAHPSSSLSSKEPRMGLYEANGRSPLANGRTIEAEPPRFAPLTFPGREKIIAADHQNGTDTEKAMLVLRHITSYYDKRGQGKYAGGEFVDSGTVKLPSPTSASGHVDPNYPAARGIFRSLITGSIVEPPDMGKNLDLSCREDDKDVGLESYKQSLHEYYQDHVPGAAKSQRETASGVKLNPCPRAQRSSSSLSPVARHTYPPSRVESRHGLRLGSSALPAAGTSVNSAFAENILYMVVVNIPTDEHLARAAEHIDSIRLRGCRMSDLFIKQHGI